MDWLRLTLLPAEAAIRRKFPALGPQTEVKRPK
jgi:hypothetical protein